jgi:hypothetical protein
MTVFKLAEGLGLTEIEVFEDTETCAVLGVSVGQNDNYIPMFYDNLSIPCFFFLLGLLDA